MTIKNEMNQYWSERVDSFAALRMKEFTGYKKALWLKELEKYIPMDRQLKILDLGTGTGFFSFLLAEKGHQVVGIDLTEKMIIEARRVSEELCIKADFYVMDAEEPDFEPESFDILITRNLTWALPDLKKAYTNWHRLLKKDGLLVNFDADYCREDPARCIPENHAHKNISENLKDAYENMKDELRPLQEPRPKWDMELLKDAGYSEILVDTGVWNRIYADFDEFYNPTPIFMLTAKA